MDGFLYFIHSLALQKEGVHSRTVSPCLPGPLCIIQMQELRDTYRGSSTRSREWVPPLPEAGDVID